MIRPGMRRILKTEEPLELGSGLRVALERVHDPRARHLRLTVNERGVRLTVPRWAAPAEANAFVLRHQGWLIEQLRRRGPAREAGQALRPFQTDWLPLRGERVPVLWREGRFASVVTVDERLEIQWPTRAAEAQATRLLRDFYLAEARADIGRWLPRYLDGLPRTPSQWRIRPLRSLWGSLSPSAVVSLDLSLVLGRPAAFEYVLVHELCHLIHANHSRAFWREVEARSPEWRSQRDYLRNDGMELKRRLVELLGTA